MNTPRRERKVLILSYYWPPAGGVRVQRVVKFCKYLPSLGWQPVILTVLTGSQHPADDSSTDDIRNVAGVYRAPAWEPHGLFQRMTGAKKGRNADGGETTGGRGSSFLRTLGEYIRLNLFVPDSRIGWYINACRKATQVMAQEKPDIVLSTAPPYTVHLVGRHIKREFGIPWVADFRDPWLENYAYNTVPRLKVVKMINLALERSVLSEADRIVCAGKRQLEIQSEKVGSGQRGKFSVIRNGYDMDTPSRSGGDVPFFYVSYFGSMYSQRFPYNLIQALSAALDKSQGLARDLRIRFAGQTSEEVIRILRESFDGRNLETLGFKSHAAVQDMMYQPQVLLLTINKVGNNELIVPAKIYEYLPTGNPILAIGPPRGEAADILRETATGKCLDYEDWRGMRDFILDKYRLWEAGQLNYGTRDFPAFRREELAGELSRLMRELLPGESS
jgi:glycosyltransferase involved in cell wall biosynthesis